MESLQLLDDGALLLVDDLLDLSCSDLVGSLCEEGVDSGEPTTSRQENGIGCEVGFSASCSLQSTASQEEALYSPPDELAELDWLSTFVEESPDQSNLGTSLQKWFKNSSIYKEQEAMETNTWLHTSGLPQILDVGGGGSSESIQETCCFRETWKAGRSRSRRSRAAAGRVWSLHTLTSAHQQQRVHKRPALHDDYEVSSLDYEPPSTSTKPRKKPKKATSSSSSSSSSYPSSLTSGQQAQPRRCSHCQVTTTPQWRAGPMGPKSLCNACGVRYKSGRLVPEYRPAASPTFATHLHSNSHKKVMEMRLLKSRMAPRENNLRPPNLHCDQEELSVCSQGSCVHTVA